MGRPELPLDPEAGAVQRFAHELRALRARSGNPSYRGMAARVHYSRTALAAAASGDRLPSLPVLTAYVRACGGDVTVWRQRWEVARSLPDSWQGKRTDDTGRLADPAWPAEPLADGADPDAAGCGPDAVTVHSRKLGVPDTPLLLGQVQLRYSPNRRAAWSRFEGFSSLDHLARQHKTDIEVAAVDPASDGRESSRYQYCYDYHWSNLLLPAGRPVRADAAVYFDGALVATGTTNSVQLP